MTRFDGRTVLVAGGTGALGRAVVLSFLAEGATVVAAGRREAEAASLAEAAGASRAHLRFVQASYAASKAAALSLVLSAAEEVRGTGVRVNAVLPGTMDTDANRKAMPDADRSGWISTEEVARAILLLCSEEARAISGAAIPVRGG